MKSYVDYMTTVVAPSAMNDKIAERLKSKLASPRRDRRAFQYAAGVIAVFVLLGIWAIPAWVQISAPSTLDETYGQGLMFHTPESNISASADRHVGVFLDLTEEQIDTMFSGLGLPSPSRAKAAYCHTGELIEVEARWHSDDVPWTEIRIGVGPLVDCVIFVFDPPLSPVMSDMHGIPVVAVMWGEDEWAHFQADFMMGDISYRVRFNDERERGQAQMTQLVSRLILTGPVDLSSFDIIVPDFRAAWIAYEEVLLESDFAAFLPVNTPEGFDFFTARRDINARKNCLRVEYRNEAFDWMNIYWHISMPTEAGLVHTPVSHAPMFLTEELTLDLVRAEADTIYGPRMLAYRVELNVLFGDVIIGVQADISSPEDVWGLFTQLLP